MLFILISDYFFELVVAIPAYIVWCIIGKATVVSTLLFLLSLVFLPLLALSLASLAGWLLSVLVKRMKRKSLYTTLLYLVFFGVYMATVPFLQTYMNLIITHSEVIHNATIMRLGINTPSIPGNSSKSWSVGIKNTATARAATNRSPIPALSK